MNWPKTSWDYCVVTKAEGLRRPEDQGRRETLTGLIQTTEVGEEDEVPESPPGSCSHEIRLPNIVDLVPASS